MKKLNKKYLVLLACVALLLTCSVGSTVAFLVDKADEVTNTFTPTHLATDVVEDFKDGTTKNSIKIRNNGNIDAWVRVAIFGYWVDVNDAIVAPWEGTVSVTSAWTLASDGYYYYNERLKPSDDPMTEAVEDVLSEELLAAPITQPSEKPTGADHLIITVIHQSIQADGIADSAQAAFAAAKSSISSDDSAQ